MTGARDAGRASAGPAAALAPPAPPLPPPDDALLRRSSGERAALYIRRLIFDGRLRQGDRVPQDDIAEALGVSRIPVREALLSLEREGWVTIRPHRGAFIGALDETAVRDHYALYGLVFGFAARRATERRTPELAARLAELCRALDLADDPAAVARLNREFDRLVLEASGSPRLRAVLRAMVGLVPGNFFALVPGSAEVMRDGARAVLAAVRDGEPARAEQAYARTLRRQGDLVAALFTERGLFAAPT
ncbi:GntR family transcriptional regulator [Actinomadura fibrosa]|uniref:GntR family transcriptional regulator n=1 Tax=Actinomadura fibrosa TaxID=111802 RepID=A0ABW2XWE1_9ACTN